MLIGNANCVPVLKPSSSFSGSGWIIDADPYQPGGAQGWGSTNIFWRQIRNFVIDYSNLPETMDIAGIHWPTGQATSIQFVTFNMKAGANTNHVGIFIENGSGGFIGDLIFNGGKWGLNVGNQQFTMRNLTFNNVRTAIQQIWDWGFTYQGLSINNCGIGILMTNRDPNTNLQSVGSMSIIDSSITNTGVGFSLTWGNTPNNASYVPGTSVIIENVALSNVPIAIKDQTGTVLQGSNSNMKITAWGQGHTYTPTGPNILRGSFPPSVRLPSMLKGSVYYTRAKPQYQDIAATNILSTRTLGAKGDGTTDDTVALQNAVNAAKNSGKLLFFDAGTYKVTSTIYIPSGVKITGEAYSVIMSAGSFFNDIKNPQPVVKVGNSGEPGAVEWSDMIVSTQGAQAGAVLIEWNLISSAASPSGMWDVHTRIGGFAGSNLQVRYLVLSVNVMC
jgi:glucan 1,3-beta-glucosidase